MTEKVLHFVCNHEVSAYERVGWSHYGNPEDTRHGARSSLRFSLMEWKGEGEPVKPFKISYGTEEPA